MKFKKITNKLNNFVVQKLKKIKNNDANNTSAMPAMPKEKSSILAENHYTELKMKDNLMLGGSGARKDANPNETAAPTTASQQQQQLNDSNKSASIANHTTNASAKNAHKSAKSTTTSSTSATTTQQNGGSPQAQAIVPDPTKIRTAHDFRFGKSIGEGSFSTVYLAKDIHTRKEYAIKVCEKQQILRERKQEYIKSEREVMHLLNNVPGFVNLYCTFQDYKSLYFVMTFAKHGDMLPHLNKVGSFDLACSQFYAAELVLSLENMHRRGIVHRDLKPENILFDEKMHTLIADFGSSKILPTSANATTTATTTTTTATPTNNHTTSATAANASTASAASAADDADFQAHRKRKSSFVGTAQYVSPEMLNGQSTAKASDLWALGCIIYQMISGLPPFRAVTEYLIFQKILKLDLVFPEGFDTTAADLVAKLLQLDPLDRLGATDAAGCYSSIRAHPFFAGIEWQGLRSQQPPPIHPYLPGVESSDEEDGVVVETYRVPDHLETGLDERQLRRMLGVELGTAMPATAEEEEDEEEDDDEEEADERESEKIDAKQPKNILNIPAYERRQRIDAQRTDNKWHQFVDDEVILKQGFVNKRKGLFARKRMLLLTTGPRLVYVDPVQMVKKGEIPWSRDVRVEPKNFKIFFVHTPNRTYYLEDPQGFALEWCQIIEDVRANAFNDDAPSTQQSAPSTTTTTKSSSATGTKKTSQRASGAASS